METFEIIKNIRTSNHLTQSDFGRILKCDRYRVADIERGKTTPTIEDIKIISKEFNISSDYLLGISDVQSTDTDVKMICEYTGLNEETIKRINEFKKFCPQVNELINNIILDYRVDDLAFSVNELDIHCATLIEKHDQISKALESSNFDKMSEVTQKYANCDYVVNHTNRDDYFFLINEEDYVDLLIFQIQKYFIDMVREFTHYDYFEQNIKRL